MDWADVSPAGRRSSWRAHGVLLKTLPPNLGVDAASGDANLHKLVARTVHDVRQLLDAGKFNVVVAKTMELVNATP